MQAKLIRSDLDVGPNAAALYGAEFVDANTHVAPNGQKLNGERIRQWDWGTVLDDPGVWRLCRQGVAIPADDECRERVGLNEKQLEELQVRYERLKQDGSYAEELAAGQGPELIDEDDDV